MKYYLIYPDSHPILIRGELSNINNYHKYNSETQQWELSQWAANCVEFDTATPRREISEHEAQRIMQAA